MTSALFKRHERIVGPAIETLAKQTCAEAIEQETKLTLEAINARYLCSIYILHVIENVSYVEVTNIIYSHRI